MAHVATPEVVAPTPAEDDAAAPAIIAAPPEDDASNKPKRPSVVAAPDSRPAPVEPLKLPESVLPVRFLETPARSDVTLAMDRMLDHVARDTKRPKLAEPEDDKGPTVADLAAYLVSRGGNAAQADGWSVGKNPRGDTIYTDSSSGRVFRSKPEVVRFLNVGQA